MRRSVALILAISFIGALASEGDDDNRTVTAVELNNDECSFDSTSKNGAEEDRIRFSLDKKSEVIRLKGLLNSDHIINKRLQ
jgi:hypothetical protein